MMQNKAYCCTPGIAGMRVLYGIVFLLQNEKCRWVDRPTQLICIWILTGQSASAAGLVVSFSSVSVLGKPLVYMMDEF